jgi:hypothetical protein
MRGRTGAVRTVELKWRELANAIATQRLRAYFPTTRRAEITSGDSFDEDSIPPVSLSFS